jgi:hypothetical protein
MAWKRGTQNNQAGAIRKGHIKEFLVPSSRSTSVTVKFNVLSINDSELLDSYQDSVTAFVCSRDHGFPEELYPYVNNDMIYLHAHEHARSVISAVLHPSVPPGAIILNDSHLVNSKVCTGESQEWTVYQGEQFAYDAREGVVGDTALRSLGNTLPVLSDISVAIRLRYNLDEASNPIEIDAEMMKRIIMKKLFMSIISLDEVFVTTVMNVQIVCRVSEVSIERTEEDEEESQVLTDDDYRGLFDAMTVRTSRN